MQHKMSVEMSVAIPESSSSEQKCVEIEELADKFCSVPVNMNLFTSAMLKINTELNVSTVSGNKELIEFKEIRDATRRDGIIYCKEVLPMAEKTITNLSDYMDNYESLEYDEWKEMLPEILADVIQYQDYCEILIRYHEKILTPLKQRAYLARANSDKVSELSKKYKQEVEKLFDQAKDFKEWADYSAKIGLITSIFSLGIGGVIGYITSQSYQKEAERLLVEKHAKDAQSKIVEEVSALCSTVMIPAMGNFIEGLTVIAAFFSGAKFQLQKMKDNAGGGISNGATKKYFIKMKSSAKKINRSCLAFAQILPSIRTDMAAIPEHPSDKNFVDLWREEAIKEITAKYEKPQEGYLAKIKNFFWPMNPPQIEEK